MCPRGAFGGAGGAGRFRQSLSEGASRLRGTNGFAELGWLSSREWVRSVEIAVPAPLNMVARFECWLWVSTCSADSRTVSWAASRAR
jgi:hypothetical protein